MNEINQNNIEGANFGGSQYNLSLDGNNIIIYNDKKRIEISPVSPNIKINSTKEAEKKLADLREQYDNQFMRFRGLIEKGLEIDSPAVKAKIQDIVNVKEFIGECVRYLQWHGKDCKTNPKEIEIIKNLNDFYGKGVKDRDSYQYKLKKRTSRGCLLLSISGFLAILLFIGLKIFFNFGIFITGLLSFFVFLVIFTFANKYFSIYSYIER